MNTEDQSLSAREQAIEACLDALALLEVLKVYVENLELKDMVHRVVQMVDDNLMLALDAVHKTKPRDEGA